MMIADDNDCNSKRGLKSMMQDNEFNTQFNTTNSNQSVQKWDNFHDSYESFPNHDEVSDSSRSIDNSDESSLEINYHDENGEVHNSDFTIYSESYRHRKKSIFSSLFKLLKEIDAEYERAIDNTLKNNVPHYIQGILVPNISQRTIKVIKILTIFLPALLPASVIYTSVLLNMFAVVTVIATLVSIPFLPSLALFLYILYKYNNCKYLTV
ncbi:hypothetical protein C922_05481 [Plasmodium inui San Antonio 1]|uniref:Pv-fam-d protein n=1 Tax=Plasmodium inui San Antonio 1 TaxID=1237626 RepID=W7A4W2_9APIC|nr:hypothetical protein C922_05481 [Plasmodium inui San Antonio 1]EUD64139.1 hypothetical protein C922_05481 [Plasmodium inui San Antonio 1]